MKLSSPGDWTLFLRNSTPTCFGLVFPDNYEGAIREFWQQQLIGNPVHVVDIGCGNGALCWIADELLNHPRAQTRITGIDFADIDPFGVLGRDRRNHPGVEFLGNTFAEDLPFADASIDLVVSQYGIEYSDLGRSIPEVARILKPGGRMACVVHDTGSEVVRLSTRYLADMRTVWSLGIHDLALRLYQSELELRSTEERQRSAELRALSDRLNALTSQVRDIVKGHAKKSQIHRYMNRLMSVFAHPDDPANRDPRAAIVGAGEQLLSHIRKIEHMQAVALTDEGRRDLARLIALYGCAVERLEAFAHAPQVTIGTVVVAVRDRG